MHLLKIQLRATGRKRIVTFHQLIQLTRLQQLLDRQIKLQLSLLMLRSQRRQSDAGIIKRGV
ncbi:hypothetical protein D3C80_1474770 [compost metagenome]